MGDVTDDVRLVSYAEGGAALGIKSESFRRLAFRRRWRRSIGNDGTARVAVPVMVLERPARDEPAPVISLSSRDMAGTAMGDMLAELRDRATRAEALSRDLAGHLARAEGERDGLRASLAALDAALAEAARRSGEMELALVTSRAALVDAEKAGREANARSAMADRAAVDVKKELSRLRQRGVLARLLNRP